VKPFIMRSQLDWYRVWSKTL